tara:strand:+ start:66 stop:338 length:273 start_codon:yes stop_codon:yes gene_type:complete
MARYKVNVNKKLCIGSGHCAALCPENFKMVEVNGETKAKPVKEIISEDDYTSNEQAADMCPMDAIRIDKVKASKMVADEIMGDEMDLEMY